MRTLLLGLLLNSARSDYFPFDNHSEYFPAPVEAHADCTPERWQPPKLQPWDALRSLSDSVTVAWMPGWHPWCEVTHYHLEARRPAGFPLQFADLEGLQHREMDPEDPDWPGDQDWTSWELAYYGLSRAFTYQVDPSFGHAVQFRVRACGYRIGAVFDLTITSTHSSRKYEIVREPYVGMPWHSDRHYVCADLGDFTASNGYLYVLTPNDDKTLDSSMAMITLNCPMSCTVYLMWNRQVHISSGEWPWLSSEGWVPEHGFVKPYLITEIWSKNFSAGDVVIRGDEDMHIDYGVPKIFVKQDGCPNPSQWSSIQTTHTVVRARVDKINFSLLGMGKNAPNYTKIVVNRKTLYMRRDETGLVLAVFSRYDFSLVHIRTYDTHRNRTESLKMSQDIRQFNQSFFIFVASTVAWEWHATTTLVHTMEYCGAFHFGQWVHIFAEQPHFPSPESDLQQTSSQDEFGHPYAFVGIPGIGTGMGWESLMHNTGQYVPPESVLTPKALIRGVAYYDYVARIYRLQDMKVPKTGFYVENKPPEHETIHNPLPAYKHEFQAQVSRHDVPPFVVSYIGTLSKQITSLIEANQTVPPFNYAFHLESIAGVQRVDPRPRSMWKTELERVWSGPSARFWPANGTLFSPGLLFQQRNCSEYVAYGYQEASADGCGRDFRCSNITALNDFRSISLMIQAGWRFSWWSLLAFKPEKWRYDFTGIVPWSSYWGLNIPWNAHITLVLKGTGTLTISIGNSYFMGRTTLSLNGEEKAVAYARQINVVTMFDYTHRDVLRIDEFDGVIVINYLDILCWGCCPQVDEPGVIATKCNVGVTPTLCKNLTYIEETVDDGFRVLDTDSLAQGTR